GARAHGDPARVAAERGAPDELDAAGAAQLGDVGGVAAAPAAHAPAPGSRALLRLPGVTQQRLPADTETKQTELGGTDVMAPRSAARRADPAGTLPHLEVGLGAVRHVLRELRAAHTPQVLEPVRVQAVVGDAVLRV